MTDQFDAARRLACLMPKDIRAMDDDSTVKLIADLAIIGVGRNIAAKMHIPAEARAAVSQPRRWADVLVAVNRILRGEEVRATDPRKSPLARSAPKTRQQRLDAIADTGSCGITATECNEWLASLPPVPLHGEE